MPMLCLEGGLEDRDDLAIHVVDGGGGEEHGADGPAHVPDACAGDVGLCPRRARVALSVLAMRLAPYKLVRLLDQAVGQVVRHFEGLVFVEPMFGDQPGQEGAIHAPRHIVPRGNGEEGARVVVEADGVVEARRLRRLLRGNASCPQDCHETTTGARGAGRDSDRPAEPIRG